MPNRLPWLGLLLLTVFAINGCPRGMPPPVFPEVETGQANSNPTPGEAPAAGMPASPGAPAAPAAPGPAGEKVGPGQGPASGGVGPTTPSSKGTPGGSPGSLAGKRGGPTQAGGATKGGKSGSGQRAGGWDFMSRLTDNQRQQLEAKVAELRAKNASPQEIFQATSDMMKKWGIEVPQMGQGSNGRRWGGGEFGKLTEEQRGQFFAKMGELRQQNASPEKVRSEAEKMLKDFGLDPSKIQWPSGRGGQGGGQPGIQPGGAPPPGGPGGATKF